MSLLSLALAASSSSMITEHIAVDFLGAAFRFGTGASDDVVLPDACGRRAGTRRPAMIAAVRPLLVLCASADKVDPCPLAPPSGLFPLLHLTALQLSCQQGRHRQQRLFLQCNDRRRHGQICLRGRLTQLFGGAVATQFTPSCLAGGPDPVDVALPRG